MCRRLAVWWAVAVLAACGALVAAEAADAGSEVVLEDFSDIVTRNDLGFNDFSGNAGALNASFGTTDLVVPTDGTRPRLRLSWNFPTSPADTSFTGIFESLFGLTDTNVTLDGSHVVSMAFPELNLDLDDLDRPMIEPGGPRRVGSVHLRIRNDGYQPVKLRVELKDASGGVRFQRLDVAGGAGTHELAWDFRTSGANDPGTPVFDPTRAKLLNLVIEHRHLGDGVVNPDAGALEIERMSLALDNTEAPPADDNALLDLVERRSCQYFLDWSSRRTASMDMPMDRSTFADLLSVGGAGFALPASVICAERGWITRAQALDRVQAILSLLANPDTQGPGKVGTTGFHGFLYHFLGPDGRRKQNFDLPGTPANEALNTVELSTIDTSLAVMGALAAQSYFNSSATDEVAVRALAQRLYDQVDWSFMLDQASQQLFLGWKPNEARAADPHFDIPDAGGTGSYSGVTAPARHPATLDYYTDEALIATLLAVGSTTHPVSSVVYCALLRDRSNGIVRTYPGSLFTYQFLHAFLDTSRLLLRTCPGQPPDDWYQNSRQAILATIAHAEANPAHLPTYGPDAWGISAAEGPSDLYRAYGAPAVAVNPVPEEDGTVTYYAMASAVSFGDDLRARAIRALRAAFDRGQWHPRFGLPDAFNDAIDRASLPPDPTRLRSSGAWLQRAEFGIDEGPTLLHLEDARSGLIWRLMAANPNIQRALTRLDELPIALYTPSTYTPAVGQTVSFDGRASRDPDGTITGYRWVWGDGTPDGTGPTPTHVFAGDGTRSVALYVTDSGGQTAAAGHGIAADEIPTAAYNPSTYTPATGQIVAFDATGSSDPDGTIASYRWVWGDGTPDGSGPAPTHTFTTAGARSVGLYITDGSGRRAAVGHGINATDDEPPSAAYTPSTYAPAVGQTVSFDGTGSADPDGAIVTYRWVWGDGTPDGGGAKPTHMFTMPGKVSVGLYIADSDGQTAAVGHGIAVSRGAATRSRRARRRR